MRRGTRSRLAAWLIASARTARLNPEMAMRCASPASAKRSSSTSKRTSVRPRSIAINSCRAWSLDQLGSAPAMIAAARTRSAARRACQRSDNPILGGAAPATGFASGFAYCSTRPGWGTVSEPTTRRGGPRMSAGSPSPGRGICGFEKGREGRSQPRARTMSFAFQKVRSLSTRTAMMPRTAKSSLLWRLPGSAGSPGSARSITTSSSSNATRGEVRAKAAVASVPCATTSGASTIRPRIWASVPLSAARRGGPHTAAIGT